LWAGLLFVSVSFAQEKSHTVRPGETPSQIAAKYGVSTAKLLSLNGITKPERIRDGAVLKIPTERLPVEAKVTGPGYYTVRNGDHDWAIAKKHGITASDLHAMNPGVEWRKLQIGQTIRVPSPKGVAARTIFSAPRVAVASSKPTHAAGKVVAAKPSGNHKVQRGDNDWIVARRYGTTVSKLHAANPGVKWNRLQIGQSLVIPGGRSAPVAKIRTRYAKVSGDAVAVRRGATTNSDLVTRVTSGTLVAVLDRQSDWYKLQFPRGTVGWVRGDFLTPVSNREIVRATSKNRTHVASNTRRTRSQAQASKRKTRPESASDILAYADTGNLDLLEKAYALRGTRYRYGGSSRSGFDCSGFAGYVYRTQGVKLPRTSREQATVGKKVDKDELRKGDLVFFKTRGSRISHVGIYTGNGKFIHASSGSGRVRVNSLSDGYYSRRYAGARRVTSNLKSSAKVKAPKEPQASNASEPKKAESAEEPKPKVQIGTDELAK
jgi:cell wall-associated NlpC family hydrolase/LysM repeat protein